MMHKFTITAEHVRNPRSLGRDYFPIINCMGRLLPCDVGKRVYEVTARSTGGTFFQVENDQQLNRRLGRN